MKCKLWEQNLNSSVCTIHQNWIIFVTAFWIETQFHIEIFLIFPHLRESVTERTNDSTRKGTDNKLAKGEMTA